MHSQTDLLRSSRRCDVACGRCLRMRAAHDWSNDICCGCQATSVRQSIFGDNMVLQRGKSDTIWGWSDPGDAVRVEIGESTAIGSADTNRRWQVKIQPPAPGGPYSVKISGHQSAEKHNVLVGDVWLRGGQSDMGYLYGSQRIPMRWSRRLSSGTRQHSRVSFQSRCIRNPRPKAETSSINARRSPACQSNLNSGLSPSRKLSSSGRKESLDVRFALAVTHAVSASGQCLSMSKLALLFQKRATAAL